MEDFGKTFFKEQIDSVSEFDLVWDNLIEYGIANEEELRLVTSINGSNIDTLNSVLYSRTGYRSWEQYKSMIEE
tara:strand:- start:253 stop:474 length:222 start_codon:yes stop_codon:yes gene_type:complete